MNLVVLIAGIVYKELTESIIRIIVELNPNLFSLVYYNVDYKLITRVRAGSRRECASYPNEVSGIDLAQSVKPAQYH